MPDITRFHSFPAPITSDKKHVLASFATNTNESARKFADKELNDPYSPQHLQDAWDMNQRERARRVARAALNGTLRKMTTGELFRLGVPVDSTMMKRRGEGRT
jgi:hypothetical protein